MQSFSLCLKGIKTLHHCCPYVLNGKILPQTSYVKPKACKHIYADSYIRKGKILRHGLFFA